MSKIAVSPNFSVILLMSLALASCATAGADPNQNDPFESTNRALFEATLAFDKTITRPLAVGYRDVLPQDARIVVRNFLDNLNSPVIFVNDVLQAEPDRAGTTFARAVVNTTVGVGGLFEVAEGWGLPQHREDFGQTLAVWGIGEGPYLMIPLLGPSNARDLVGRGVDFVMDPLFHVRWGEYWYVPWVRYSVDIIDLRSRAIEQIDNVERTSADFYGATRSLYRQNRTDAINNGAVTAEELPGF
jgi:phospholipid-binding lipoprotein MlaA